MRTIDRITQLTDEYWNVHVTDQEFISRIQGKEPGHRVADYVDEQTSTMLKAKMRAKFELDPKTLGPRKRSMGDVWVFETGAYHPINIKAGLLGAGGQPNVVSMQKVLDYIFRQWIDSYYVLIVKFDGTKEPIAHRSYLIDMLDWIEFLEYNAGPGQIMLKEAPFYEAYDSGWRPAQRSIREKTLALFRIFETRIESLIKQREMRLRRQRALLGKFEWQAFTLKQSGGIEFME